MMKKLRSQLPRRKRTICSPVVKQSVAVKFDSSFVNDDCSNLTRDVAFSCDSSSRVSVNDKLRKRRGVAEGNGAVAGEFRRITRSYSKRMAVMAEEEVSEASSCVELFGSSSKELVRKGTAVVRDEKTENAVCEIENSDVTMRSECSTFVKVLTGREKAEGNEETDVVSVSSRRASPQPKFGTSSQFKLSETIDEGESSYSKASDYTESVASRLEFHQAPKSGEITSFIDTSATNKTVVDDQPEKCEESKPISAEFDLTCPEHFSSVNEECGYSSAESTDANTETSEYEFSSDFATLYDSGSQFSERSFGDTTPSATFQLFLLYRQKFCKSEFSTKVSSEHNGNQPSKTTIVQKLLRPEDEEHEESYQMMKERERRQLYLHNYAEDYRRMKDYGNLILQQRSLMAHWIVEQSAEKELQKETMFLGVSFLDRLLSKGFFGNRKEIEIAGIACLTLATRIEENQPYNSIQQKYFKVGRNEYSRSEVVAMEWLVQEVLNFQCYLPTIYNFLWFYLKAARADERVARTANYLAVSALLGLEHLCYWPSTVAASLVCLACLAQNKQSYHQQITWILNGSSDEDLPDCIRSMECLVQSIR